MFWKYLCLTLLLLSPGSRIFSDAHYEQSSEARDGNGSQEDLVDRIMKELGALDKLHASKDGEQPSPGEDPTKRAGSSASSSEEEGEQHQPKEQQLQQRQKQAPPVNQELGGDSIQLEAQKPIGSGETGAGETSGESAIKGSESVYHTAGKASPLQQNGENTEGNKETKIIASEDTTFMITMAVVLCVGFVGLMMGGVCYYKFKRGAKAASDVEYPAYGVTGPMKERVPSPGDRKLAQSAQMYHYQHQKQQMIAMEKANGDMKHDASDDDSEDDNVEGDYTVYECPGLAPTGEMEVKNPLFRGDDPPHASPSAPPPDRNTPPRE